MMRDGSDVYQYNLVSYCLVVIGQIESHQSCFLSAFDLDFGYMFMLTIIYYIYIQ